MSPPIEFILSVTAATLIGVGSIVVVLDTTAKKPAAGTEKNVECVVVHQGETVKCIPKILGETEITPAPGSVTTTPPVVEKRIERVEDALDKIMKRLDQIEKKVEEKKE